jgi:predicted dehydrogenase
MALRIGFVGTGGIARAHMGALDGMAEAQVVACTDVDADRAAEAAARFAGAAAYTDHREMLDAHELDAAYVCVPPHAHGEIELDLIERGIPFLVEKPIGNDRETPRRVLEALDGTDLITSVAYMTRYRENARRLKDFVAQNEPVVARGAWLGGMPGVHWWRRKHMSGGQIMEQSTHVFDLVRFLFGEVASVFCVGRTGLITDVEDYSVEDASICTLTFESGLLCEVASSCAVGAGEVGVEVFTRNGRATFEDGNMNLTIQAGGVTTRYAGEDRGYEEENRVFVEALLSGDAGEILSPYEDAFRTQMVTCAANESMESGQPARP